MSSAGEVSLVAEGENVFLPSIDPRGQSSSAGAGQYSSASSGHWIPSPEAAHSKANSLLVPKKGVCGSDLLSTQLGELSKALSFSPDAVCALGPDVRKTYASAREDSRALYCHRNITGFTAKPSTKKGIGIIGRHNVRGPGKKHLMCNLTKSSEFKERKIPKRKVNRSRFLFCRTSRSPFLIIGEDEVA